MDEQLFKKLNETEQRWQIIMTLNGVTGRLDYMIAKLCPVSQPPTPSTPEKPQVEAKPDINKTPTSKRNTTKKRAIKPRKAQKRTIQEPEKEVELDVPNIL